MITKIEINGFKTFENFSMVFSPFVVIAGTNGSGKSNLFDAIRLLSGLAEKDLKTTFAEQRGSFLELFTQYSPSQIADEIRIVIELFLDSSVRDEFNKEEDLGHRRLSYEIHIARTKDPKHHFEKLVVKYEALKPIKRAGDKWYKEIVSGTKWESEKRSLNYKPYISTESKGGIKVINLRQDGIRGGRPTPIKDLERTVLSGVNDASFPHAYAVRKEMINWKIFQLSPIELGKPSAILGSDTLDVEGRNLAALIKRIQVFEPMALNSISRSIHQILPEINRVFIDEDQARQQYVLMIESSDGRKFSSNVLSEGTLRIIALIALNHDERHRGLICFEEPENGIHPYRMKLILRALRNLSTDFERTEDAELPLRQIFLNTHSPILIKEINGNPEFKRSLIYFSRLVEKIDGERRTSYKLTRFSAVKNENTKRMFLESVPAEDSVTHHELVEYLNVFDSETNFMANT
jgi:predicted ATPase